jgi:hypothetical protein
VGFNATEKRKRVRYRNSGRAGRTPYRIYKRRRQAARRQVLVDAFARQRLVAVRRQEMLSATQDRLRATWWGRIKFWFLRLIGRFKD